MNMKKFSILLMAAAAVVAAACSSDSAKYNITGVNVPAEGTEVFLVDQMTSEPINSAVVSGGSFNMKGTAAKDAYLSVTLDGEGWFFPLFNDGKPVRINYADSTLTGSALNTKLSEWDKKDAAAYNEYDVLFPSCRGPSVPKVFQGTDKIALRRVHPRKFVDEKNLLASRGLVDELFQQLEGINPRLGYGALRHACCH